MSRFDVFTTMKIQVVVYWVATPRSYVVGYLRFGGTCCLHLQGEGRENFKFRIHKAYYSVAIQDEEILLGLVNVGRKQE